MIYKDFIICIIGKSGSGKSTIVRHYKEKGYNIIESYTDRPKRFDNEWGHVFIKSSEVEFYRHEMIAYTFYDGYHYFSIKSQYKNKGITFYVIEPSGVKAIKDKVKDAELLFIYIDVDEAVRKERMLLRLKENILLDCDYEKVNRDIEKRIINDREIFKKVDCNIVIDNNYNMEDTISIIDDIIMTL
ncbi:guanylate kinase [Clostridium sp. 19966]|uniref:guanylate kinase n=1 Tax=Clostridium sp. 19966 TaxID=2768166 RepID=UPI0028DDA33E|nr:guanylate kinase [Clostridium sp. 19966]MDT8716284.1 guanylate kinase [Clostridium sp. 19966]